MSARVGGIVKIPKADLECWMGRNGFELQRGQWIGKTTSARVQPGVAGRVIITIHVPTC